MTGAPLWLQWAWYVGCGVIWLAAVRTLYVTWRSRRIIRNLDAMVVEMECAKAELDEARAKGRAFLDLLRARAQEMGVDLGDDDNRPVLH